MAYSYSSYRKKEPLGQRIGRFVRKWSLRLAFAGAVGGVGGHYYGTREKIDATIVSVEAVDIYNPNGALIVHTDKGDFINEKTRFYLKGDESVAGYDKLLRPGAKVELTVYGYGFIERLGMDRNIVDVVTLTPPRENKPVTIPTSNPVEIAKNLPQLERDLDILSRLPITGKPIYDIVTNPANHISSHVVAPDDDGAAGTYSGGQVRVDDGARSTTAFHEYFHAAQDVHDGKVDQFVLTAEDGAFCNLLIEASAVAYELACEKEAGKLGIPLFVPQPVVTTVGGMTHISWRAGASSDETIRSTFNDAYDDAWGDNASLDAAARERAALSAGGKAVVRYLMQGKNPQWATSYAAIVSQNINNNPHAYLIDGRENKPGYIDTRNKAFSQQGLVAEGLNFTPDEYLGTGAATYIQQTLKAIGLNFGVTTASAAPAKTPSFGFGA